jgi:DNA-binding HxlR family transcriptional regulator
MPKSIVNCSIAKSLAIIGERWSLLIVREAVMGSTRFDEFQARLGIARNILNARLVSLVKDGILEKQVSPDNARVFHYRLTEKGRELLPVLVSIMQWGDRWVQKDIGAPIILRDRKSGAGIKTLGLSTRQGKAMTFDDVIIIAGPGATPTMRRRLARSGADTP